MIRNLSASSLFACLLALATIRASSTDSKSAPSCPNDADAVLVSPGTKLNDNARFPVTLEGDWERFLVAPEVEIVPKSETAFWTEGPILRKDVLYVSDPVLALIYRITHVDGKDNFEVWATQSGGLEDPDENIAEPGCNGMATDFLDPEFVIINQQGLRRVVRCKLDEHKQGGPLSRCPGLEVITDSFPTASGDRRYNSPNDVVVHPEDGSIWFTDPIYGLLEKTRFCDEFSCSTGEAYLDAKSEIGWKGVYRVDRQHENFVELFTKFHRRPNGLGFTPDGSKLWVADSTNGIPSWTAYDMDKPWECCDANRPSQKASSVVNSVSLGNWLGRTEDLPSLKGGEGLSDGFKFDEEGYLWTSIPNGFAIIDTVKQEVICQILLGTNTSNLAFGKNGQVWLTGLKGIWKMKRRVAPAVSSTPASSTSTTAEIQKPE